MNTHAGLYVHRNTEKGNTLWYLEYLISLYLHNKIQPILFPFLHRLVWLLNPKPHPPLDDCQSEPQARGELSCVRSVPMQVVLFFFFFSCSVVCLFFFFCLLFFFPWFLFCFGFFIIILHMILSVWDVYLSVYIAPKHIGLWSQIWVCVLLEYK